jgi:GNAT superfamily N-acetyltransferase
MNTTVRFALNKDFESVWPLFKQLWPNKSLNQNELSKVFNRGIKSDSDVLLILELDNNVIGFCAYAIMNNLWQEGYISYIYAMVIDEKYRGKGYGSNLLQEAINKSREHGIKRVELDSGFPREKAHRFYEKLGFEKRAYLFSYTL